MFAQFKTLPQLFDYFKDEQTCMAYWIEVRWEGNITCPRCGHGNPYTTSRGYRCTNIECQKKFSALVGSIFENTKIPLRTWFAAIYMCTGHKKGVSSLHLSRELGIHAKSAWFLLHRIREAFGDELLEPLGGEGVVVETDETYIGGKVKNMSNAKRKEIKDKLRGVNDNKTTIMGYIERSNRLHYQVLRKEESIHLQVTTIVNPLSVLMTDSATTYTNIGKEFAHHGIVDHSKKEYVRDVYHTNTIEGSFSHLDRMVIGIYHYVSPKHMQAYCNEQAYRYNTRKISNVDRFEDTVRKFGGKRLTYNQLVADA